MAAAPAARRRFNYGGFVVAAVGFLLTRYTVLEATRSSEPLVAFLVGPAPFLVLGLGLSAFGVALAVSAYPAGDVRTVAWWCLAGLAASAAVVGTSVLQAAATGGTAMPPGGLTFRVLLGGTAAGVLVGSRSAAVRRQRRRLGDRADRLTLLNRLLRHEVLNKVNVVAGYAALDPDDVGASRLDTIRTAAGRIETAIDEVGVLARPGGDRRDRCDLRAVAEREARRVREETGATVVVEGSETAPAWATDSVGVALRHLLESAVDGGGSGGRAGAETDGGDAGSVRVSVTAADDTASVRVAGAAIPAEQRATLNRRTLPEYDDPGTGFGLTVARLVAEGSGGRLDATAGDEAALTLTLPAADGGSEPTGRGVPAAALADVAGAALVAGAAMGFVLEATTGNIAVIGALYGVQSSVVGWATHQFHSVVFGVGFAAVVRWRGDGRRACRRAVPLGVAYAAAVWLVAAGFVMPLWLRTVGMPAPVPFLTAPSLFGHVVWGAVLGGTYAVLGGVRSRVGAADGG
jgi:signal transduction histidine kinase